MGERPGEVVLDLKHVVASNSLLVISTIRRSAKNSIKHLLKFNFCYCGGNVYISDSFYFRLSTEESLPSVILPVLTPTVGSNVEDITFSKRKCIRLREVCYLQLVIPCVFEY